MVDSYCKAYERLLHNHGVNTSYQQHDLAEVYA
jgi:hypothetical protein